MVYIPELRMHVMTSRPQEEVTAAFRDQHQREKVTMGSLTKTGYCPKPKEQARQEKTRGWVG
jgi:hypothetical protein